MTGQGAERCGLGFRLVQTLSGPSAASHGQLIIKLYPCLTLHTRSMYKIDRSWGPGGGVQKSFSRNIPKSLRNANENFRIFFSGNVSFAANPYSQCGHC